MDKYCIIYARVSTASTNQRSSYEEQLANDDLSMFHSWAKSNGYKIYKESFSDIKSATTTNRPGFIKMLEFLGIDRRIYVDKERESKEEIIHFVPNEERIDFVQNTLHIDRVVCKNTARFSRNRDSDLIDILRNNGYYIYFLEERLDTKDLEDGQSDVIFNVIQSLDKSQSQDKSNKVITGLEQSIKRNHIRTCPRIYGFKMITKTETTPTRLIADKEEAKVIKRIFDLYTNENLGTRQIQKVLTSEGYLTRDGKPFGISSLKRILSNEKYCGYNNIEKKWSSGVVFNKTSPKQLYDYKIVPNEHIEPIISYEQFMLAQKICADRRANNSGEVRGRKPSKSPYWHKIKCGYCGKWYVVHDNTLVCPSKRRPPYESCGNKNVSNKMAEETFTELGKNFKKILYKQRVQLINNYLILLIYYFYRRNEEEPNRMKEIREELDKLKDRYDTKEKIRATTDSDILRSQLDRDLEIIILQTEVLEAEIRNYDIQKEEYKTIENQILKEINLLLKYQTKDTLTLEEVLRQDIYIEVADNDIFYCLGHKQYDKYLEDSADGLGLETYIKASFQTTKQQNEILTQIYNEKGIPNEERCFIM